MYHIRVTAVSLCGCRQILKTAYDKNFLWPCFVIEAPRDPGLAVMVRIYFICDLTDHNAV